MLCQEIQLENVTKIVKKKLIIFDVDGVLFDSKKNMSNSWKKVKKKFKLKKSFNSYFSYVGLPFSKILFNLRIKDNLREIERLYKNESLKLLNQITLYPNVKETITNLRKNYKLAIVTSKDITRTKILLKKNKIPIQVVISPNKTLRGKPHADPILKAIKKSKVKKNDSIYIGDTMIDYKCAINSGIRYIHAKYGYSQVRISSKYVISKFNSLPRMLRDINF